MKAITLACCILGIAFAMPPQKAQAGDEGWAALGGFVVGGLFQHYAHGSHHRHHYRAPRTCYVPPAPACPPPRVTCQPTGHYETRTVKTWVPGTWIYETLPCGTVQKVWQPGYYQTEKVRVWVQGPPRRIVSRY